MDSSKEVYKATKGFIWKKGLSYCMAWQYIHVIKKLTILFASERKLSDIKNNLS